MVRPIFISGIVYSVVSAIIFPFLLYLQIFSIFLFDSPGYSVVPYLLALGILLIPILLVVANVFLWLSILKQKRAKVSIFDMGLPVVYTILFFALWALFDVLS